MPASANVTVRRSHAHSAPAGTCSTGRSRISQPQSERIRALAGDSATSAWIDTMAIENAEALFDIIDRHPQVKGLLWGHVHQTFEATRRGVRLMASPSTCVQFAPRADGFTIDQEPPGFRLLALLPDGSIKSEVMRIDDMPVS